MSNNYRLDDEIQRYQDDRKATIAHIAAHFIARNQLGRDKAIKRACEIYSVQRRGLHDITGVTATRSEAQMPVPYGNEAERKQIYAIAQQLLADDLIPDEDDEV